MSLSRVPMAVAAFLLLIDPGLVLAADCVLQRADDAGEYLLQLSTQVNQQCFTVEELDTVLGKSVEQQLNTAAGALGEERWEPVLVALGAISDYARTRRDAVALDGWKRIYEELLRQITRDMELIPISGGRQTLWAWDDHKFFVDEPFSLDYASLVRVACASGADSCSAAAAEAVEVNVVAGLTRQVLKFEARPRVVEYAVELQKLKGDWDYYFDKGRSQFIWELLLNARLYEADDGELAPPPAYQFILFHPMVALEYVGAGPQNEQAYNAAALVELIGYNRLPKSRAGSKLSSLAIGGSIVGTYTAENIGDRIGIGAMVHINNNWSFGFTRRDTGAGTETTWLVSADLLKTVLKKSSEARAKLRCGTANDCIKDRPAP